MNMQNDLARKVIENAAARASRTERIPRKPYGSITKPKQTQAQRRAEYLREVGRVEPFRA
jgi:hypothetical protein